MDAGEQKIYVARENEEDYRLFSPRTARGHIRTGLIRETDLAWCEGMNQWAPLIRVLERFEEKPSSPATVQPPPHPTAKVSSSKIAEICFQMALSFQETYTREILDLQAAERDNEELNFGQIWVELIYLGCVVVDHAIEASLSEDTREFVLKLYRSHLYRVKIEGVHSFRPIKTRLLVYGKEAHQSHTSSTDELVGQMFAQFCGAKNHRKLVKIGSTLFHSVYEQAMSKLASLNIKKS